MNLFVKIFILATTFYVGQVQALILQQGQFIYKKADNWERVIGLSNNGFILKKDSKIMTFEPWRMHDLLVEHKGYMKSLEKNKPLYSVADFVSCSLLNKCIDSSLKSYLSHTIFSETNNLNIADSCTDNKIKCMVFKTSIDNYTFEAYVYTNANKDYFIRILTNINSKSDFMSNLNAIELDIK